MVKRFFGVVGGAALLAATSVGTAQAVPSYAYANINFTDFTLSGIFNPATSTLNNSSVLLTNGSNYPGYAPGGGSDFGTLTTGADVAQAFSGPGPAPSENTFTPQLSVISGTRGDGVISGPISGAATSHLTSEGNLTVGPASAGSNAGSSTTINVTFTALASGTVELKFNASAFLSASVGQNGDSATALTSASYNIFDQTTGTAVCIFDVVNGGPCQTNIAPNSLNRNVGTTNFAVPSSYSFDTTGNPPGTDAFDFTAPLLQNHTYQLTLADSTQTILATVPEPVSIALLGSGIFALGMARRRSRK